MDKNLVLPLKREFFEAIRDGSKVWEYRLHNSYWCRRLLGKRYRYCIFTLGYPKRNDCSRRIVHPFRGWQITKLQHDLFGPDPVKVFAIYAGA
jgi:hypothetical protein